MGRHKKDIIKSVYVRFRVEPEFRKQYFLSCKKRKTTPSKEMRQFMLNTIEENGNS